MAGTSPPGPLRCGSTTCRVKAVAMPASKALPPFSKVAMPTAVAIQWVEATTPKVPSISGRVVKKLGLMLLIEVPRRKGRHFTTGRPGGQPPASAQVPAAHRVGAPTVGVNWRASGRARTIGRRLCVVRLAGGLIAEHRAPSLDLARRLAHLGAQSLFREIAVP